jgi:hypothetical protein
MAVSLATSWGRRFHPVALAKDAGIILDPWQEEMVSSHSSRLLLNCSRQIGKSTTTGVLAVYTALYKPSLILLLSPSLRQSQELFKRCIDVYRRLDRPVPPEAENALSLELNNGSRIVALPGKEATIRGLSGASLLVIDEASRVQDALYKSVRPMLAVSQGRLILLSSPFGTRGFFYEEAERRAAWDYYEIPATQCPRISPAFLEEEKERLGDWWYQQEYCCKFMDSITAAFRSEDIKRIVKKDVEQWAL